jgi:heme A synthase
MFVNLRVIGLIIGIVAVGAVAYFWWKKNSEESGEQVVGEPAGIPEDFVIKAQQ